MISTLQFLRPYWLLALLPAAAVWWGLWRRGDPRNMWSRHIAPHLLAHLMVKPAGGGGVRPLHVLALAWGLMILALAGPAWRPVPSPFAGNDAGVMVVLKVTPSMTATDVAPSRLERALQKLRDFVKAREGAPTGLVVYSGTSHLVMPMTRDADVLLFMTEGLEPAMMPEQGDALADALSRAETLLERSGLPGSTVLFADGVSEDQRRAAAAAALKHPVQMLSVFPGEAPEPSLAGLAKALGGKVTSLSIDDRDVTALARRAAGAFSMEGADGEGTQLKDDGYLLLPLLTLCVLMWARKGWVVR
jgi:Ca-activated chloride channel family protein